MSEIKRDYVYERAIAFASNYNRTNHTIGFSNIYVIQKSDMDGKITGEYYGMNLMTDYGMQQYFINGSSWPTNLYIGNGAGEITVASNALISPVTTTAATASDTTISYGYPLHYFAETGLITATCRFLVVYFDYAIPGIDTPVTISEYGIGTATNALWTHSWVYDNLGRQVTITKNPNERLTITVYFCLSYSKSMIDSEWNNGKHIVITTMERFFNRMREDRIRTFKRYNVGADRAKSNTESAFDNVTHTITAYANMSEFTLAAGSSESTGYIDGVASYRNGFLMVEHEMLPTAETFDVILDPYTSALNEDESLSRNFGDASKVPVTQTTIQHSYTFDHKTGAFDSEETVSTTADKWFTETTMSSYFAMPIYYTTNQTITQMYVYQNLNTNDPIIRIDGALSTVYATDEYWNTSSWTLITDLTNVPVSERSRKYWITPSNTVNLEPVREHAGYIVGSNRSQLMEFTQSFKLGMCNTCSDEPGKYFVIDNRVFDTSDYTSLQISTKTGIGNVRTFATYFEQVEDTTRRTPQFLVIESGTTDLTMYSRELGSTWTSRRVSPDSIDDCFTAYTTTADLVGTRTYSGGVVKTIHESAIGFVGTSTRFPGYDNIMYVYSGVGSGNAQYGVITGCVINASSKYAYINNSDPHTIVVSDLIDSDVYPTQTFTFPSTAPNPLFMFGFDKYVYVTDGATYMYVIDMSTGVASLCDGYIPDTAAGIKSMRQTATDDCMIIYHYSDTNMNTAYVVRGDNPTHVSTLQTLTQPVSSRRSGCQYTLTKIGETNVLIYEGEYYSSSGTSCEIFDFSRWLYDGTVQCVRTTSGSQTMTVLYGDRLCKQNQLSILGNYIQHRVVGTTKTITTLNTLKHLSDKQWQITYTNIPSFNGLPPGTEQ